MAKSGSVPGTRVRGNVYSLNLRIPAELRDDFDGKTHLVRSCETRDPRKAADVVTLAKSELLEKLKARRRKAELPAMLATLTADQRALYDAAGGLEGLLKAYSHNMQWLARAQERRSDYPPPATAYEEWVEARAEAEFDRYIAHTEQQARAQHRTLIALGENVRRPPSSLSLTEWADAYFDAKNATKQNPRRCSCRSKTVCRATRRRLDR